MSPLDEIGVVPTDGLAGLTGSSLKLGGVRSSDADATLFPARNCEFCGLLLTKRIMRETVQAFGKRRFCNHTCSNNASVGNRHNGRSESYLRDGSGPFPIAIHRGTEAKRYKRKCYADDPRAITDRGSPGTQAQIVPNFPPSKDSWR